MTRRLARIALVAALMVGVVAMHSFGHRGHSETHTTTESAGAEGRTEPVMVHHHMAHESGGHGDAPETGDHRREAAEPDSDREDGPLGALSMLGFMICGGVLLRVAFEVLRLVWPRLLASLAALPASPAFRTLSTRFRHPPPLLTPTSLLLNRIAVLRI